MNYIVIIALCFLFSTPRLGAAENLPKETAGCVKATKKNLAKYEEGNVPGIFEESKFLTPEFAYSSKGVTKATDGSFTLELKEVACGDTQHYSVTFRDKNGNVKPVSDPTGCGENFIEISPNSKFILLSGLRYLDVKKWEVCPLLGENAYGYQHILGWSKDGNKILVREYDDYIEPSSAEEYIIEIKK